MIKNLFYLIHWGNLYAGYVAFVIFLLDFWV